MHVLVCPVSGGAFPVQLGFMIETAKLRSDTCRILPFYDVALASSGGNLATYIAMGGDFTSIGIEGVVNKMSPSIYLSSWWPKPFSSVIPSWTIGYYKGSLYDRGNGGEKLFEDLFTYDTIGKLEVWTGTLNRSKGKAEIFTNLCEGESRINTNRFLHERLNAMPLNYARRDPKTIARISYASAAIPVLIPSVKMDDCYYVDGGTAYSSPLTPLQDCLKVNHEENLHIDYLSSYDLESNDKLTSYSNIVQNSSFSLGEIIKSLGIQDRLSGIELVGDGNVKVELGSCKDGELAEIYSRRLNMRKSFLELYPDKSIQVPLESFTPKDIIDKIQLSRKSMMYRLWYTE